MKKLKDFNFPSNSNVMEVLISVHTVWQTYTFSYIF